MTTEYPADVLEAYADDSATCAWARANDGLGPVEALTRCDDLHVLLRLWSVSVVPIQHVYRTVRVFALKQVGSAERPLRDEAVASLHVLG